MSETPTYPTDWATPGTRVALERVTPGSRAYTVRLVTVERVTKRDIVMDDGTRVRRDTGDTPRPRGISYSSYERLHPADAPEVEDSLRRMAQEGRHRRVTDAYNEWDATPTQVNAARLHAAVGAVIQAGDEGWAWAR